MTARNLNKKAGRSSQFGIQSFASRTALIAQLSALAALPNGTIVAVEDVPYVKASGATAIEDLPGLLPVGDPRPEHWGEVAQGDDDTEALQAALDYAKGVERRTVRLMSKTYKAGALTAEWGVSLIGQPETILHLSSPLAMGGPALFRFSTFKGIRFAANGIVPYAINATAELENISVGEICGLNIHDCKFIALDADIDNPGFRASEDNFFHKAVYMYDVAFASYRGNTFVGGFNIADPSTEALDSCAVQLDGQCIRFSWASDNNIQSYENGIAGEGAIEGFFYEGGETIYCRRGINVETSSVLGGGWIKGGHFNCSERGIYFKSRKIVSVIGVNVWRNSFYEDRPTWAAVELDTVQDSVVDGVFSEFNTTNFSGVSDTVLLTNCTRVNVVNERGRHTTNGLRMVGCTDIITDVIGGQNHTNGISVDATSSKIHIGLYDFVSTTNPLSINASATGVTFRREKAKGDGTSSAISAAGSETIDVRNTSWVRRTFNAGSGAYVYDITLGASTARMSDEIKISLTLNSLNATVNIYAADGALLHTFNAASGTYVFQAEFTGVWRKFLAIQSS